MGSRPKERNLAARRTIDVTFLEIFSGGIAAISAERENMCCKAFLIYRQGIFQDCLQFFPFPRGSSCSPGPFFSSISLLQCSLCHISHLSFFLLFPLLFYCLGLLAGAKAVFPLLFLLCWGQDLSHSGSGTEGKGTEKRTSQLPKTIQ